MISTDLALATFDVRRRGTSSAPSLGESAQDAGAYKPADNHFVALHRTLSELRIERNQLLHAAQSLFHDHVPAHRHGLSSVWINRRHDRPGWGATPQPIEEYSYGAEFASMREFAAAVETAFSPASIL